MNNISKKECFEMGLKLKVLYSPSLLACSSGFILETCEILLVARYSVSYYHTYTHIYAHNKC